MRALAGTLAGWTLWSLFVVEFLLRMVIARSTTSFLKRNWWQVIFLVVPFLRFLRAFSRSARVARAVSGSVRGTRTASRALTSRIAWLATVTVGVVLTSSQPLHDFGPYESYAEAMHDVTLAAVAGEPIDADGNTVTNLVEIALVLCATVFFAALAGAIGAFFVADRPSPPQWDL